MVSTQKIQHTGNKHWSHGEVGEGGRGECKHGVYTDAYSSRGGGEGGG